uniref:ZP domain-containing protein n=1 Tax=Acanthochromis polyacanthus TaxID=80966 RepID=A0A3Q1GBK7_9TELE
IYHFRCFVSAGFVQSECRDRYLWIHVASGQMPRFEAVDGNGIHSIGEQLASRCGYTISTFKMDGYTTFRASYYSCFTQNQNDEVFTFNFNVLVSDGGGRWTSQSVSAVCPGLTWTHREVICEEDYMEVRTNSTIENLGTETASLTWQLMFRQRDGQVSSMSVTEAQRWGYSLTTTAQRVVLRSPYKQPHAEITMVDGVSVKVVQASLFFKQKLVMVMIDMSMDTGSFDGNRLLWDIPRVLPPLVREGARFESRSVSLGVESMLLDEPTMTSRGFNIVQQGGMIQISVPFGAKGGYRKSLVVNNMYKETYTIFLLYEHIFSLLYEDGSSIETRHRMLRVLDTPLVCRPPFSLNRKTVSGGKEFSVYLGNIPSDVILEDIWINGKRLPMSDTSQQGFSISPVVHTNGSRSYELQLPFEDENVHWVVSRSRFTSFGHFSRAHDLNFTLTILPQRNSYYYHTFITARVFNRCKYIFLLSTCSDEGISFSVAKPPHSHIIWEVGIDNEPLTPQLVAQRGYRLYNNSHRSTLEVPVFSVGYTYEEINLSNFYATFKLLLRDSKTLEIQTSTSKRCLFRTEDMIVCSPDGTMTVVTTPSSTWPTVQPEKTTLLDPTCKPKETDGARALFEFKLDSCGTRAMVKLSSHKDWSTDQLIYRKRILVTVRCFYPLSAVNRLSVERIFKSVIPGFGSVKVFESHTGQSS